jgi:hypothetical protein
MSIGRLHSAQDIILRIINVIEESTIIILILKPIRISVVLASQFTREQVY